MKVETFEIQEMGCEVQPEVSEEAIQLINELELEGQRELISAKPDGTETRVPYREIRKDEWFVYSMLCPSRTPLRNFKSEPIPLRVLQVLSHAKSLDYFSEFEIWHRAEVDIKDPVAVAYTGQKYGANRKCFILARWGDELESWPTLVAGALAAYADKLRGAAKKMRTEAAACEQKAENVTLENAMQNHYVAEHVTLFENR